MPNHDAALTAAEGSFEEWFRESGISVTKTSAAAGWHARDAEVAALNEQVNTLREMVGELALRVNIHVSHCDCLDTYPYAVCARCKEDNKVVARAALLGEEKDK